MLTSCNGAVIWNSFVAADKSCKRYTTSVSNGWKKSEKMEERKRDREQKRNEWRVLWFATYTCLHYNGFNIMPASHTPKANESNTQSMYTLGGWHFERHSVTSDNAARQSTLWHICVNRYMWTVEWTLQNNQTKNSVSFTLLFINLSSLNLRDALKKERTARTYVIDVCCGNKSLFEKCMLVHSGGENVFFWLQECCLHHYINNGCMMKGTHFWTVCTGSFRIYLEFCVGFSIAVKSKMHRSINIWGLGWKHCKYVA